MDILHVGLRDFQKNAANTTTFPIFPCQTILTANGFHANYMERRLAQPWTTVVSICIAPRLFLSG